MTREEAIKEIKSWDFLEGNEIEAIQTLIPELAESEDERVRRELIEFIQWSEDRGMTRHDFHQAKRPLEWIAYLEKQKEKEKYDRMMPVYDNLDSFESALAKAWKTYNDSGSRTVDGCEDDYVECAHAKGFREGYLFGLEKQKEQKPEELPAGFYVTLPDGEKYYAKEMRCNGMNVKVVEPKPAEWSEEDEETLDMCLDVIPKKWKTKSGILLTKWLKDNIHPQSKQEWSEEDEEIWFTLITFLKGYLQKYPPLCKNEETQVNRILNWLNTRVKSFRLHHRYKPTEDQMKAMKNIAYGFYQNGDGPILRELYDQLNKLM